MTILKECQPTKGFPNKWVFPKKGPHLKDKTAKEDTYPDKHQRADRRHSELPKTEQRRRNLPKKGREHKTASGKQRPTKAAEIARGMVEN